MTRLLTLFVLLLSAAQAHATPWQKSPQLEKLIVQLNHQYREDNQTESRQYDMKRPDNLSYFLMHINEKGTPEHEVLKAYLWGTQEALLDSNHNQIRTNVTPWFCPPGGPISPTSYYAKNRTEFVESLIYETIEYRLNKEPDLFTRSNGAAAFMPLSGLVQYGLQVKYPCFRPIPVEHRIANWVY